MGPDPTVTELLPARPPLANSATYVPPRMQHVLIVDDERDLVELLRFNLERQGFTTASATTGAEALQVAKEVRPELVLLDVMLPDMDGIEVCRHLRAEPGTASALVLMLSARRDEADRIAGLQAGADDYMTKPFSVTELMLKVQAASRRWGRATGEPSLTLGPIRLDLASHRCFVDGAEVTLTVLEFRLLHLLVSRAGKVQSRETLLAEVWRLSSAAPSRTLDTHVLRLRDKLGAARPLLETVRGVGYRMKEPEVTVR